MKVKHGAIVVSSSGKLGGQLITMSKSSAVMQRKRGAKAGVSSALAAQNLRYSSLVLSWSSLSKEEKINWEPKQPSTLTAFSNYISHNMYRSLAGLSPLLSPILCYKPFIDAIYSATFSPTDFHFFINYPLPIEPDQHVLIYATKAVGSYRQFKHSEYRFIGAYSNDISFPINIYSDYIIQFGSYAPANAYVGIKVLILDDASGCVSDDVYYRCIVQSSLIIYAAHNLNVSRLVRSLNSGSTFSIVYTAPTGTGFYNAYNFSADFIMAVEYGTGNVRKINVADFSSSIVKAGINGTPNSLDGYSYGRYAVASYTNSSSYYIIDLLLGKVYQYSLDSSFSSIFHQTFLPDNTSIVGPLLGQYLARSTNLCKSFSSYYDTLSGNDDMPLVYVGGNVVLAAKASTRTILRSTDGGLTYSSSVVFPVNTSFVRLFYVSGSNILAFYRVSSTNIGLFRSTNGGISWSSVYYTGLNNFSNICSTNNKGVICITMTSGGYYLRSSNYGVSWSLLRVENGLSGVRMVLWLNDTTCMAFAQVVGTYFRIYRSTDAALTWSQVYQSAAFGQCLSAFIFCPNNQLIY